MVQTKLSEIISDEKVDEIMRAPKYIDPSIDVRDLSLSKDGSYYTKNIALSCNYPCHMKIRQTVDRPLNFSVILTHERKSGNYVLVRYNGNHGSHTNRLTKETINGPHIHYITEEYQRRTTHPDGYAISTDKYTDINGAIAAFMEDMHISIGVSQIQTNVE